MKNIIVFIALALAVVSLSLVVDSDEEVRIETVTPSASIVAPKLPRSEDAHNAALQGKTVRASGKTRITDETAK